ncbi:molybdenum cofactor guanylyltransferase [Microbacterium sp. 22195]|uniref:molybdenum cofactor guanylyltransferase n=1 Tax=Microbacterium sp. 22195 TaxID=3453891 RepID=UPI003F863F31
MVVRFGAALLAGGRASRMGGIDKPGLLVDGVSMRDRAIDAVVSVGASPVIVVGPEPAASRASQDAVRWMREDPPFSGPAAAVVTALGAPGADATAWTILLACDLPHPDLAVARLLAGIPHLAPETDGACLVDATGRAQWLTGVYRTPALVSAASALPDGGRDRPVRALLAGLSVKLLADPGAAALDVDTWEDYEQLTKEHP